MPDFDLPDDQPLRVESHQNTILRMENNVPGPLNQLSGTNSVASAPNNGTPSNAASGVGQAVGQAVDRSLEGRRATAQDEVERLVAAAFRVIERGGHLEPKVSDILAEAGLSNQAFYRHFRGKHALLVAVLDEGIRGLAEYLSERMAEAEDEVTAVRQWIRGMAAQAQDPNGAQASRPFALARGRLAEAFPAEVAGSEGQITAPLRDALERARGAGRLPAVHPDADAEALYHLMMGWVEARLVEGRIPDAAEVDRLEAFALAGLGRPVQNKISPAPGESQGEQP